MKPIELKFVLKLLGHEGYRASISKLNPSDKTSASDRDRICRDLAVQEIVSYSREVSQFKIEPAGTALLKQDVTQLPLSEQQIAVLKACAKRSIKPGELEKKVPAAERQSIIQDLEAKGLLKAMKAAIKEVWLTERGKAYLLEDYNPSGTASISLNLLQSYLRFMRKEMQVNQTSTPVVSTPIEPVVPASEAVVDLPITGKPSDTDVLSLIQKLDHELGAENYLPIFHLRQKLQPPLSRDDLDEVLYRLQRSDAIELSSLQEADAYTADQIDAGIPQNVGGPLFFITIPE